MKSGASQTFNFNKCSAEKKVQEKRIPILRSSLGLHQMKTKSGTAAADGAAAGGAGLVKSRLGYNLEDLDQV